MSEDKSGEVLDFLRAWRETADGRLGRIASLAAQRRSLSVLLGCVFKRVGMRNILTGMAAGGSIGSYGGTC